MKRVIVFPGQRVVTKAGNVATVAFTRQGHVYVYGSNGLPVYAQICGDAFGGEHDQELGLVA